MQRLFFILSCLLFLSCRKEANIKLPATRSLPVMYSYISPTDTVISLKLLSSSPLYGTNQIDVLAAVSDANVKISSAQGTAQLVFNQNTQYYELKTSTYPIVPGQIYKMTVTTSQGDIATAITQVPSISVPINAVTVEQVAQNGGTSHRIKVSFTDEQRRTNYYRIGALYSVVFSHQVDTLTQDTYTNELYSDINHDGENVSLYLEYLQKYDFTGQYSTEYYDVFLYNCSESYYHFHKSLRNYSGDNPFAEPTLIYSNVKGGFGCFAAYMQTTFRYKKK